jgi:hypothetical protein
VLSVRRENLDTGKVERVPAVESGVQKLLDLIYGTKRWMTDLDHLVKQVRAIRYEVYGINRFSQQQPAHAIEDWEREVRKLHDDKPEWWTVARLSARVKQPVELIERTLIAHAREVAQKAEVEPKETKADRVAAAVGA